MYPRVRCQGTGFPCKKFYVGGGNIQGLGISGPLWNQLSWLGSVKCTSGAKHGLNYARQRLIRRSPHLQNRRCRKTARGSEPMCWMSIYRTRFISWIHAMHMRGTVSCNWFILIIEDKPFPFRCCHAALSMPPEMFFETSSLVIVMLGAGR